MNRPGSAPQHGYCSTDHCRDSTHPGSSRSEGLRILRVCDAEKHRALVLELLYGDGFNGSAGTLQDDRASCGEMRIRARLTGWFGAGVDYAYLWFPFIADVENPLDENWDAVEGPAEG